MTLESTLAGSWYPATAEGIHALIDGWEKRAPREETPDGVRPNVLILPHAGWAYSGETAWRAVRTVRGASFKRVVVIAPSHRAWIENRLVAPEADSVSTPLGTIRIDREGLDALSLVAPVMRHDRIHACEHAAQIEYPLLQCALARGFTLLPLVVGSLGPDQMGMCARALNRLMTPDTLLVLSSDFTHYGEDFSFTPFGVRGGEDVRRRVAALDHEAFAFIGKGDASGFAAFVARTGATVCGHVPIELALRSFPRGTALVQNHYATSSDESGDYSRFVCYLAASGYAAWPDEEPGSLSAGDRAFLLHVARASLEDAVRKTRPARSRGDLSSSAPAATREKRSAFVTLTDRKTGALRGCIGEILPVRPLVEAVAARAVDAALHDPRFSPVTADELPRLRVEVSALTPPKRVGSWRDIVLGRDGMTVEKDGRFAVFLPQVAPEQAWSLSETLSYLSQKAGLGSDAWRDGATFETFQAEVFHE